MIIKACERKRVGKTQQYQIKYVSLPQTRDNVMVDSKKIFSHTVEMAEHANGAAQYLEALLGGRYVTREQTRDMVDYMFAGTKRNIESCPFATQDEKDAEIHRRELLLNALKPLMGI